MHSTAWRNQHDPFTFPVVTPVCTWAGLIILRYYGVSILILFDLCVRFYWNAVKKKERKKKQPENTILGGEMGETMLHLELCLFYSVFQQYML